MDYFRDRRQNRQQRPRPTGRLANAWHSFVNVMFYCILHDVAVDNVEVPDEAAERVSARQDSPLSLDPLNANHRVFHNHSTHEPRPSNWRTHPLSVSASVSASVSGCSGEKDLESKKASGKKNWLSWSWRKISNKSDSSEGAELHVSSSSDERKNLKTGTNNSFEDNLSIQDLEWVNSPGSSGIVSNGDGSTGSLSGLAGDLAKDIEKKTVKGKTKKDDASSGNAWTSIGSIGGKSKKVQPQESVKTEKKNSKWPVLHRFDVVPGGTIPDVYKLIKSTLNLGISKPTVVPPKIKLLRKACQTSVKADKQKEEREAAGIPWTKTPSLHRLHTEWDEDIINIEIILGLKKPKNSREALAVMKQLGHDAPTWRSDDGSQSVAPDNSTGVSTSTVVQALLNEDSKPAVEDVDSGVASRGVSDTTN